MKKLLKVFIFLIVLITIACSREQVKEVEKEEYTVQDMDVDYSMIEYELPKIEEEYEILKAYKNRLYILIHDVKDEDSDKIVDSLMIYDFQAEREVKRYNFQKGMKIHDLIVYQGDIYISFGDGGKDFFNERAEATNAEETENNIEVTENNTKETVQKKERKLPTENLPTDAYFGKSIENKTYSIGKLQDEGITLVTTLEKQKFAPKFLYAFDDLYYLNLKDGEYNVSPLIEESSNTRFSFDFVDEIQDRIYSSGDRLIAQGKENKDSYFYIVDEENNVEKIPIEPSEQFFSFIALQSGIFSSYTDIFDRESLKIMYIDINPKGEEKYKKKIVSSDSIYKFYSNNTDNILAEGSGGDINFIRVKRSQIYRGKVSGIGDNRYKILPNEDSRYGFIDEEHGKYLDIYFN